jgi:hypothetical protein
MGNTLADISALGTTQGANPPPPPAGDQPIRPVVTAHVKTRSVGTHLSCRFSPDSVG